SIRHRLLQPSPLVVLPSSQASAPAIGPAPQIAAYWRNVARQRAALGELPALRGSPDSTTQFPQIVSARHEASEPSPGTTWPSTHSSPGRLSAVPSPQISS